MAGNTFGRMLRLTSFGESHGSMIGGVIDGFPSGLLIDFQQLQDALDKRAPGNQAYGSPRKEPDLIEVVSGVFEGRSTGAPIAFLIKNTNQKSADYDHLRDIYRPSHAAYTYEKKYGNYDHRGGGRSSARETAVRVAAGAFCSQLLAHYGISITGYVSQIGPISTPAAYHELDLSAVNSTSLRCPDQLTNQLMESYLEEVKTQGDSAGGIVTCIIKGVPAGVGEPVYDRFQAVLGAAMLSINAVKGFEYGEGFAAAAMKGSEHNDVFESKEGRVVPATNHAGGILAGISTGQDIWFRVAFKPVSSISKTQHTVDKEGNPTELNIGGRHDVCIVPRAVPVVEAMAALSVSDLLMLAGIIRSNIS